MNDMDEIREVNVVQCEKGHLYPGNIHKTCPFCIEEAKIIERREALKKGKEREFHINTRWENFKHLFDQCREDFKDLCAFLNDKFESYDPYKNDPWRDEHYWDLYR